MGVTGLWRLIEPAGKPVPVETLENKVLAVDISIWLHQMVKGYQDAKGAPLPNAHLMGLFQRLCKLLYFRIKPVFVFDGAFPDLKKETIAKRQDNKSKYNSESERLKRELAILLGKKTAIGALLGKQISPKKGNAIENDDDLFKLPALPQREEESESESEDEQNSSTSSVDLHTINLESEDFKKMPVKQKYDLLLELKETRKMNSWGKLETLPKKSDNFSDFQMQRLLKRRKVQECIEETEKEMGDVGMSLTELETLLNEEGIETKIEELPTRRIASDQTTRYLLINTAKQRLIEIEKHKEKVDSTNRPISENASNSSVQDITDNKCTDEYEDDLQKAIKMSLECVDEAPNTSASSSRADESWTSCMTDSDYTEEEYDEFDPPDLTSAKEYIMQYTDFTHDTIKNMVSSKSKSQKKQKALNVSDIINDINQEKTIIEDKIELTSEDDTGSDQMAHKNDYPIDNRNSRSHINSPNSTAQNQITDNKNKKQNQDFSERNKIDSVDNMSVICLENDKQSIICLDDSTENDMHSSRNSKSSSSSEDELEEVTEIDINTNKPIVQLTLDIKEPMENDIFADVFEKDNEILVQNKSMKCNGPNKDLPTIDKEQLSTIDCNNSVNMKNKAINNNLEIAKEYDKSIDSNKKINAVNVEKKLTAPIVDIYTTEKKNINTNKNSSIIPNKPVVSSEKLEEMVTEIENEHENLLQEKGRLDRIGRNISEQMKLEAQELLRIFGIPYIVAPMEAEAQCAFLENAKLTDGTITDDSDIWLFGGRTVYKNFFNQKKHVLQFLSERIEKSFNLTREQLILLALLVGSDYTTGVTGVGPVTALEILASFPFNKRKTPNEASKLAEYHLILGGLNQFKQWVKAGKRTDNVTLKKKLKNVKLTDDFPSVRVVLAYLEPNVDHNKEKFTWGEIDITILRDYTKAKFGWSQSKLDEIIKPVLKRLAERKNQKTVHDYFKRKLEFQSLDDQMSKRVKAAVKKMDPTQEHNNEENLRIKKSTKKTGQTTSKGVPKKKLEKDDDNLNTINQIVKVSNIEEESPAFDLKIPRTVIKHDLIPQREKVKQSLLENKLKAIEIYRKSKIDKKRKFTKRKPLVPKDKAELSESSDSN